MRRRSFGRIGRGRGRAGGWKAWGARTSSAFSTSSESVLTLDRMGTNSRTRLAGARSDRRRNELEAAAQTLQQLVVSASGMDANANYNEPLDALGAVKDCTWRPRSAVEGQLSLSG